MCDLSRFVSKSHVLAKTRDTLPGMTNMSAIAKPSAITPTTMKGSLKPPTP
jgi:hypothetical protein